MNDLISSAFLTLFVIIDPIGLVPIFMSISEGMTSKQRRNAAIKAVVISAVILTFFAVAGHRFFELMGISLPAFRIAGGLLLFWIAFEMAFEKRTTRKQQSATETVAEVQHDDIAAFPLSVPLMAGPGAITAIMLLSERAGDDPIKIGAVLAVLAGVLIVTGLLLLAADPLDKVIGTTLRNIITRLLGVVLAALAVQFVVDGVTEAFLS